MTIAALILLALLTVQRSYADNNDVVRQIYERLARASGDPRRPPRLVIHPASGQTDASATRVAWFDPVEGVIGVDEKAVRLCMNFGVQRAQDCVALFLGHELAHFYKDHQWGSDFGSRFSTLSVAGSIRRQQSSSAQVLRMEAQADEVGGIYGYIAGYDTLGVAPEALEKVYRTYRLESSLRGYPSLRERKEIARKSAERLQNLLPAFDAGNLLLLLGRFEESARCFDFIAKAFPSREILNNEGVARALAAAQMLPATTHARDYPWTLDGETRLAVKDARTREAGRSAEAMLREAQDALQQATKRDPSYIPAWINLANVSDLLGQHGTALDQATEATRLADKDGNHVLKSSALLAKAIATANSGQAERAAQLLSVQANEIGSAGELWTAHMAGKPAVVGEVSSSKRASLPVSSIDGLLPDRIRFASPPMRLSASPDQPRFFVRKESSANYLALLIVLENERIYALSTRRNSSAVTNEGLHIGSTWTEVLQVCKNDAPSYASSAGRWLNCPSGNLVFEFDADGSVGRWATYIRQP